MLKWQGLVTEIYNDQFTAELTPMGHEGVPVLADFNRSLLGDADARLLQPGDTIYVTVRHVRGRGRVRTQTSAIKRRRLGFRQPDEIAEARALGAIEAEEISSLAD